MSGSDETTTATPMPAWDVQADYVNAACRLDKQKAEVAKARTALRQEEQRLDMLVEARNQAFVALVNAPREESRHDHG